MANPQQKDNLLNALRRSVQGTIDGDTLADQNRTLRHIAAAAVEAIPGAAGASITRSHQGAVRSGGATEERVARLDAVQAELKQGPCLDAAHEVPDHAAVLADDLGGADAERWPGFASLAVHLGYRSILSTNIPSRRGRPRSSLNLYGVEPHAFDDQSRTAASIFATQAFALLHGADEAHHLHRALASRDMIAQAKGILMERFAIRADAAFEMLVTSSQRTNMKLAEVARWLVAEAEQGPEDIREATRRPPVHEDH